jgi:SAM-dependent methyltransferase
MPGRDEGARGRASGRAGVVVAARQDVRQGGQTVVSRLSALVPHPIAPWLRRGRAFCYLGDRVECPCCGGRFRTFLSAGKPRRPGALCPRCSSLERHRLVWLFLAERTPLFRDRLRVLYVAPEQDLQRRLRSEPGLTYVSGDRDSALAMVRFDLERLPVHDGAFDVVICTHVLEHVDDARAALRELLRVLRPGGWALLQSPVDTSRAQTLEDRSMTSPAMRLRAFGQEDHVRIFGRDYTAWLSAAGFEVEVVPYGREAGPERVARHGLDPEEDVYLCRRPVRG